MLGRLPPDQLKLHATPCIRALLALARCLPDTVCALRCALPAGMLPAAVMPLAPLGFIRSQLGLARPVQGLSKLDSAHQDT